MTIHIPTKYLVYGGIAIAAGLAYWYLKQAGYWDQWFSPSGSVIPVGPSAPASVPQAGADSIIPGAYAATSSGYVN